LEPRFLLFASPDSEVPKRYQRGSKEEAKRKKQGFFGTEGVLQRISGEKLQFVTPLLKARHSISKTPSHF
jgi:hypothetical protein